MREELPVDELPRGRAYRLLTACIVPRPIAWVSSRSADGVDNLAPHSFFTVASSSPPVVQFTSIGVKDSVNNILETGEFVVHLAPDGLIDEVNATGTNYPPGVDEFDAVGLAREPSRVVAPMRVAASPVAMECTLRTTIEVGNAVIVLGDVVHFALDRAVLADDGLPSVQRLGPLARLGRNEWSRLGEVTRIDRIPYEG